MTVAGCDGVIAANDHGAVFLNAVLATSDRCWFQVHITGNVNSSYDAVQDLMTWNEESLSDFRNPQREAYDLRLTIDGRSVGLEAGPGRHGVSMDVETGMLRGTHSLTFPVRADQRTAVLELRWDAMQLRGRHSLDLAKISAAAAAGAY